MSGIGAALVLASARIWALLRVQASWQAALGRRWEWIAAALAVSVTVLLAGAGRIAPVELDGFGSLVIALGFELALGSVIGLAASLPGWALVGAAAQSEQGLELRGSSPGTLAALLVSASLAAGLSLGLHRPLLAGLFASFDRFALAEASTWLPGPELGAWLIGQLAMITALALALATPVLLTRALIEIGVASLGRVGFEAASLCRAITPALRLGAALVALGAAWSAYPEAFARGL
ncbi:MAG: flagellar biosynthetic protein FliR [Enhygromyxa sp.]